MQPDQLTQLFAFTVNTLGGGIVGAIVALCMVKTESARDGLTRSVVSIIVSGAGTFPAMRLLRWQWPSVPDDNEVRFLVQLTIGVFGYHLMRWVFNEFKGTEEMKLSAVLRGFIKVFGPIFARLGSLSSNVGKEETKP
jgi:uncharacterized membrane protein YeaQ/YmgE (transglycosylase-associated protein family)